jgi:hypothetical protein
MKALTKNFLIVNQFTTTLKLWESYRTKLGMCWLQFRSFFSSLVSRFLSLVARSKKLIHRHVHAGRDHVSPALTAMALSITVNLRTYLGWCLVGVSPAAACVHMWFDRNEKIADWYHESYFHLFMLLGPYLFCLVVFIGIYLVIPPAKEKTIKVFKRTLHYQTTRLMAYPIGFAIGKIIWFIQTTSNEQYWDLPTVSIFAVGLALAYLTITQIDYWTWKKFHAFDGIVSSLNGLYDSPYIENRDKIELAKPYMKELKEFHSKY